MASALKGLTKFGLRLIAKDGPVVYPARVAWEVTKTVWNKEKLGPPSLAEWPAAQNQLRQLLNNLSFSRILDLSLKDALVKSAIGFQIFTFFLVGEIIGRRSLLGYNV